MSNVNLTENEHRIILIIKDTMDSYSDGFSDLMIEDFVDITGWDIRTVKGVLGSLIKKSLVGYMDVNQEYNVYYLHKTGFDALGIEPDYYDCLL